MKTPKKPRQNIISQIRFQLIDHIRETPNIPDYLKPLVEEFCRNQMHVINNYLTTIELSWRRTLDSTMDIEKYLDIHKKLD